MVHVITDPVLLQSLTEERRKLARKTWSELFFCSWEGWSEDFSKHDQHQNA